METVGKENRDALKENTKFFQEHPNYKFLKDTDINGIVKSAVLKSRNLNEIIYDIGDRANKMYYVKKGIVKVFYLLLNFY